MSQTAPDQEWPPSPPEAVDAGAAARYGAAAPSPASSGGGDASASTIVLLVVSGLLLLGTFWTFVGVLWAGPAALAVVALVRSPADPAGSRRLTRIGWWVTAALGVLGVLLVALAVVVVWLLLPTATSGGYDSSTVGLVTALVPAAGR